MTIRFTRAALAAAASLVLAGAVRAQQHTDYAFGADLSFLKQQEDRGVKFKDAGVEKPGLQIFRDHGYNWIRLRICVEPVKFGLPNDLAYTLAMAKAARALGFKFFLTFHYSNAWADPTKEPTPDAWQALTPDQLVDQVFTYTRDTIAAFRDAGLMPDMVGIGNEIGNGILWPEGKLPEHWDTFAALVYAGINGVDAGRGNTRRPKILLHVDHGGDPFLTRRFFDQIDAYGIPYDVVGVSFYPWSHGTLLDLRANLRYIAEELHKDVMVVETGYYWKPSRYFRAGLPGASLPALSLSNGRGAPVSTPSAPTPRIVEASNPPAVSEAALSEPNPPFPETPEGQRQWLEAVNEVVMQTPDGRGKGVFWWEPAAGGGLVARGYFDEEHNALPIMSAFDRFTRPAHRTDHQSPPAVPPSALRFGPVP